MDELEFTGEGRPAGAQGLRATSPATVTCTPRASFAMRLHVIDHAVNETPKYPRLLSQAVLMET
jgi:hypothetical protein